MCSTKSHTVVVKASECIVNDNPIVPAKVRCAAFAKTTARSRASMCKLWDAAAPATRLRLWSHACRRFCASNESPEVSRTPEAGAEVEMTERHYKPALGHVHEQGVGSRRMSACSAHLLLLHALGRDALAPHHHALRGRPRLLPRCRLLHLAVGAQLTGQRRRRVGEHL